MNCYNNMVTAEKGLLSLKPLKQSRRSFCKFCQVFPVFLIVLNTVNDTFSNISFTGTKPFFHEEPLTKAAVNSCISTVDLCHICICTFSLDLVTKNLTVNDLRDFHTHQNINRSRGGFTSIRFFFYLSPVCMSTQKYADPYSGLLLI